MRASDAAPETDARSARSSSRQTCRRPNRWIFPRADLSWLCSFGSTLRVVAFGVTALRQLRGGLCAFCELAFRVATGRADRGRRTNSQAKHRQRNHQLSHFSPPVDGTANLHPFGYAVMMRAGSHVMLCLALGPVHAFAGVSHSENTGFRPEGVTGDFNSLAYIQPSSDRCIPKISQISAAAVTRTTLDRLAHQVCAVGNECRVAPVIQGWGAEEGFLAARIAVSDEKRINLPINMVLFAVTSGASYPRLLRDQ
jgi:hypothetical protein